MDIAAWKTRLRHLVEARGGVSVVAKRAGMRQPSLSRLLNSASVPRSSTVHRLARALDIPVGSLLPRSPEAVPEPLLKRIIDIWNPLEIWLFGSRASGDAREHSDWDLLVIVPDDAPDRLLDPVEACRALGDIPLPVDLIAARRQDFDAGARLFGTLAQIVTDEGAVVYAR
jgi:transcriptional regulator with XRE-family HTH domain